MTKGLLKMEAVVFSETFSEESIKPIVKKIVEEEYKETSMMFQMSIQEVEGIMFPNEINNGKDGRVFLLTSTADIDMYYPDKVDVFKDWIEKVLIKLTKEIVGMCRIDYTKSDNTVIFSTEETIDEEDEEETIDGCSVDDIDISCLACDSVSLEIFQFIIEEYSEEEFNRQIELNAHLIKPISWELISQYYPNIDVRFILKYSNYLSEEKLMLNEYLK